MANQDDDDLNIDLVFTQTAGEQPQPAPSNDLQTQQNAVPAHLLASEPDHSSSTIPAPPAPPKEEVIRLGRYTLERLLGRGGMAEVYLAKQDGPAGFQKTCVVKRIRKSLLSEEKFVDMFLREARVAARLNHANTVQIFELGQEGEEYFIAMEYLDGISLHRAAKRCWASEESISMEVVLRTIADAAQGLHHAHTLRDDTGKLTPLIHRDISPDNLMLTRDGVTKVLDFGIAKSGESDEMTRTGELKGKIPFMSPEQIMGDPLDGRSDLWALGITFYWLLTGQRPFDGKSDHMTIDQILRAEPKPPRELNPLIPAPVQKLILSLLVKNREKRLASGAQLHDLLVSLLGPASGNTAASEFAQRMLVAPANEGKIGKSSQLTCIAARPHSAWLKRSNDNTELLNLIPMATPLSNDVQAQPASPQPAMAHEPSTDQTVSGMHTSTPSHVMTQSAAASSLKGIVLGLAGLAVLGLLVIFVFLDPNPGKTTAGLPPGQAQGALPSPAQDQPVAAVAKTEQPPPAAAKPHSGTDGSPGETAGEVSATDKSASATAANETPSKSSGKASKASKEKRSSASSSSSTRTRKAKAKKVASRQKPAPEPAAATKRIRAKGPASVIWRTTSGKRIGQGSAPLDVPENATSLKVEDKTTGGKNTVPIVNRVADYDALGKGGLAFRIRPWAEVKIGRKNYGTTPLDPIRLVAGTYRVKLKWESKEIVKTIRIEKGKQATIKQDMRK